MKQAFRQASRPTAGFTMFELLIVIVMVGILAAIAAPTWERLAASRRASTAQNEILQLLRQAQADAIRTRQPQTVTFNTTTAPPTVQVNSQAATRLGEETTQTQLSPTILGLQVSGSSDAPNNVVEFDSRGAVTRGVNMVITATSPANRGNRRCVIVETILGTLRTEQNDKCRST